VNCNLGSGSLSRKLKLTVSKLIESEVITYVHICGSIVRLLYYLPDHQFYEVKEIQQIEQKLMELVTANVLDKIRHGVYFELKGTRMDQVIKIKIILPEG
jgi:hypothetical protein